MTHPGMEIVPPRPFTTRIKHQYSKAINIVDLLDNLATVVDRKVSRKLFLTLGCDFDVLTNTIEIYIIIIYRCSKHQI